MLEVVALTLVGFLLILFDLIFIPGGVFVVAGSILILYGVYLNYGTYGFFPALVHFLLCLAALPKLITWSLGRVALKGEMNAKDGFVGVEAHQSLIGQEAIALSDLRPSGKIIAVLDEREKHLDCVAEGGFIEKGATVIITEERGPSLIVRMQEPSQPSTKG